MYRTNTHCYEVILLRNYRFGRDHRMSIRTSRLFFTEHSSEAIGHLALVERGGIYRANYRLQLYSNTYVFTTLISRRNSWSCASRCRIKILCTHVPRSRTLSLFGFTFLRVSVYHHRDLYTLSKWRCQPHCV